MIIDVNTFCGHWPFRKIPTENMDRIKENAEKHNINSMIISSLNSIFYEDPQEGDEEIASLIPEGSYQAITVNPTIGWFDKDIEAAADNKNVKAVRIHPEFHKFRLTDKCVTRLFDVLYEHKLPLIITSQMEDPRAFHWTPQNDVPVHELLSMIISNKKIPVVFTNLPAGFWGSCEGMIKEYGNLNFDTSGIRFGITDVIEKAIQNSKIPVENIVFGSQYPLFSREAVLNLFTMDPVCEDIKEKILYKNAKRIFNI